MLAASLCHVVVGSCASLVCRLEKRFKAAGWDYSKGLLAELGRAEAA